MEGELDLVDGVGFLFSILEWDRVGILTIQRDRLKAPVRIAILVTAVYRKALDLVRTS